jgi:hypothetical protein
VSDCLILAVLFTLVVNSMHFMHLGSDVYSLSSTFFVKKKVSTVCYLSSFFSDKMGFYCIQFILSTFQTKRVQLYNIYLMNFSDKMSSTVYNISSICFWQNRFTVLVSSRQTGLHHVHSMWQGIFSDPLSQYLMEFTNTYLSTTKRVSKISIRHVADKYPVYS